MEEDRCSVAFPTHRTTASSLICSCQSLLNQLKKKDPNAAAKVIWGDKHRMSVQVSKTCSHCSEVGHVSQLDDRGIVWRMAQSTSVQDVIRCMSQVEMHLGKWLVQNQNPRESVYVAFSFDSEKFSIQKVKGERQKFVRTFKGNVKQQLLLIDGSNVLSMSYFATATQGEDKLMRSSNGLYTNAVYGMVRKVFNLLRDYKPTHLAICWDVDRETFRRQLYAGYKAERSETPEPLKEQFKTAQKLFHRMGIKQLGVKGFEADDLIGTVARQWQEAGDHPCYIVSGDKDLYQLLAQNVTLIRPTRKGDVRYSLADFEKEYELRPSQWIDVKAILGESGASSDCIPGVKGIGEKTAVPLIREFGSLDGVYAALETLSDTSFKRCEKKLVEGREMAYLSQKLATIVTDVPDLAALSLAELSLQIKEKQMRYDFQTLGFRSILHEMDQGKYKVS